MRFRHLLCFCCQIIARATLNWPARRRPFGPRRRPRAETEGRGRGLCFAPDSELRAFRRNWKQFQCHFLRCLLSRMEKWHWGPWRVNRALLLCQVHVDGVLLCFVVFVSKHHFCMTCTCSTPTWNRCRLLPGSGEKLSVETFSFASRIFMPKSCYRRRRPNGIWRRRGGKTSNGHRRTDRKSESWRVFSSKNISRRSRRPLCKLPSALPSKPVENPSVVPANHDWMCMEETPLESSGSSC